jgi:predicted nuclease with TOPRIM domain
MPALAFKDEYEEEVPMSASDETGVALLRDDIRELKADLRAMATKTANDFKEMWDRIDRQFAHFREDMREMRAETRHLREKLDTVESSLNARVDGVTKELAQLNSKFERFGGPFSALRWIFAGIAAVASVIAAIASARSAFHIF